MARAEWLRTFVAVYRSGSVTDAARLRGVSQPAASQQLAALERAVGTSLFVRSPAGMAPTERGRALYAEVCSALDQLEGVLAGLDAGRLVDERPTLRIGSSTELFAAEVLHRLVAFDMPVVAAFGDDADLLRRLEHGELDVAVTSSRPSRRSISARPGGEKRFVLVAAPGTAPPEGFGSLGELGAWCCGQEWVAYSSELPITRRFWQHHLGRPFAARLRLVDADLRVVLDAVTLGVGVSLLPSFLCAAALRAGQVEELHPVAALVDPEPWYVCTRQGDDVRPDVAAFLGSFGSPGAEAMGS